MEHLGLPPRKLSTEEETKLLRELQIKNLAAGTRRQKGQGMVEYALILVLVSIVVIVILLTMGQQIQNVFSNVVVALGA